MVPTFGRPESESKTASTIWLVDSGTCRAEMTKLNFTQIRRRKYSSDMTSGHQLVLDTRQVTTASFVSLKTNVLLQLGEPQVLQAGTRPYNSLQVMLFGCCGEVHSPMQPLAVELIICAPGNLLLALV